MNTIFSVLASIVFIYSILIFIRIILSWFSMGHPSKLVQVISSVTDPYLNWWRRRLNLKLGIIDLSPLIGIAFLSILLRILYAISGYPIITAGIIFSILLDSVWSIIAFILGFCFILLLIRLLGSFFSRNPYSYFWGIINTVSQPILNKISSIFYRNRIPNYKQILIVSLIIIGILWIGGNFLISYLKSLLIRLSFT